MDCREFSNLLDAYLDGALSPEEAARLEDHGAECAECAALLTLRRDCRRLDEEAETPEEFSSAWRQAVREEETMEQKPKKKAWGAYLAAAAALVFILGGTALTRDRLPSASRTAAVPSAKRAASSEITAQGALSNVVYEDYDMEEPEEEAVYDTMVTAASEAPMAAAADTGAAKEEKIIRTASFTIRTDDFEGDLNRLMTLAEESGGRAEYVSSGGDVAVGQARYAYLTLRIPTERLDAFLEEAEKIGSVTDMTQERQDVSDSYYDTQSRLDTQREKLRRLQALMEQAESMGDLVEIESAAADAQYWIDRYTSQLKSYDSRISYSTVSASLREVKSVEMENVSLGQRMREGIRGSLRAGGAFAQDALVFLVSVLPWLVLLGLAAAAVGLMLKRGKKQKNGKE